MRSSYKLAIINDLSIVLIDEDYGKSLTNDAPNVIKDLESTLPDGIGKRSIYYMFRCNYLTSPNV